MGAVNGRRSLGSFQPTARTPSLESHYSEGIASADVELESSWTQAMGNTMQSRYEEIMRLVRSRPTLDAGFQDLLENLRDAKDRGDDLGFMAILAVIQGELNE